MGKRELDDKVLPYLLAMGIASVLIFNSNLDISIHHAFAQTDNGTYQGPIPEDNSTFDNNPQDFGNGPIPEDNTTLPYLNSGMPGINSTIGNPPDLGLPDQNALPGENGTTGNNSGIVLPIPAGNVSEDEKTALQNSKQIIQQLEQESTQLQNPLQSLLSDLQSGQYYGSTMGGDSTTSDYSVTFAGSATSKNDNSTTNLSGEIFIENIKTGNDAIKYKVTGGHLSVGNTSYEIAFGKARVSNSSQASLDSMTLIAHATDNNGNPVTIYMLVQTASSLQGSYGSTPVQITIQAPYSMINDNTSLNGSGQLSLITS